MAAASRIVLILPRELVETLTALANRKGLSRSAYIRMVLTEYVRTQRRDDKPKSV
jgi:metal-responsive CopG/Arc/MetJ family transcriptional regulator